MIRFGLDFPETFVLLIDRPWVTDGFNSRDSSILERLSFIESHVSPEAATTIRASILSGSRRDVVSNVSSSRDLAYYHPESFEQVWQAPWLSDGISADEWALLRRLAKYPDFLTDPATWQQPWTQDGIDQHEQDILVHLAEITKNSPDLPDEIEALTLFGAIEPEDRNILAKLAQLSKSNVILFRRVMESGDYTNDVLNQALSAATHLNVIDREYTPGGADLIAAMPFLKNIDPWDVGALESMKRMSHSDNLRTVMQHPAIQDGITDQEAKVVATLHGVMRYNPELLDPLLSPDRVKLEERTIVLPMAGETLLIIIRTEPGSRRTMDLLEHAVRSVENFMAESFPTNYIAYLIGDAVDSNAGGAFFGTHITSKPYLDNVGCNYPTESAAKHIAHEISHYYWNGRGHSWVNEGVAQLLEAISERERSGQLVQITSSPCTNIPNIVALDHPPAGAESEVRSCKYRLSERFFFELHQRLGEDALLDGLNTFYVEQQYGVNGLVRSFKEAVPPAEAFLVDLVVARWYGPTTQMGPGFLDTTLADPLLPIINGRIENLSLNLRKNDNDYHMSSGDPRQSIRLTVEFTRQANGLFELPLDIAHVAEDGSVLSLQELTIDSYDRGVEQVEIAVTNDPGQYLIVLVQGDRKVGEVPYQVVP